MKNLINAVNAKHPAPSTAQPSHSAFKNPALVKAATPTPATSTGNTRPQKSQSLLYGSTGSGGSPGAGRCNIEELIRGLPFSLLVYSSRTNQGALRMATLGRLAAG
jgi:hypothetical protein